MIGDKGAKVLGESLKHNTTLTWLFIGGMKPLNFVIVLMSMDLLIHASKGNGISAEGAKALGETLKHNSVQTMLDLGGMIQFMFDDFLMQMVSYIPICVQIIRLAMKEL